jgi:hypothetical protein
MKTVHLSKASPSVTELLAMARKKSVLLVARDGTSFVLEEADEFDREVAELGNSARFMRFLRKRSREKGETSIEQLVEELNGKGRIGTKPPRAASGPHKQS